MPDQIHYIPRMINLSTKEFNIVERCVRDKGLGGKGFSAAIRLIINEWDFLLRERSKQRSDPSPTTEPQIRTIHPDSHYDSPPSVA